MGDLTEVARRLAQARKPKRRLCPACGAEFVTIGRGKYCSPRCRARVLSRARYWRNPEAERARRREYYRRKQAEKAENVGAGSG